MSKENLSLVRALLARVAEGGLDAARDMMHPDFEMKQLPLHPEAGTYRGARATESMDAWVASFEDFRWDAEDFIDAGDRVDASPFGLTGGLFARNPDTVDRVIERSPVGNLYVNRAITGAMVARQPFGGNRLSGTGTKAGGPGYLLQFVEPRVVTENTMRHGLVV